jgi:SAM-dependent methyltransferase
MQETQPSRAQAHRPDPQEIEALLLEHPDVKEALVLAPGAGHGSEPLEAYVVADLSTLKRRNAQDPRLSDAGLIHRWNALYEVTYTKGPAEPSFVGWTSSYTRQPISEIQMDEWLQGTLQRIRTLKPQRLLEIGCGVGLLLQHLAPQCSAYVGTDFSATALGRLREWLSHRADLGHVELLHRAATELEDLQPGSFDTVVLNSVVQYFPNIEYLLTVLGGVRKLLLPGGRIFIGDVRNLQLLPTFHSAVQLSRAPDSLTASQLKRRVARAIAQETELALDPRLFQTLSSDFPEITAVDVQLRRGAAQNELSRYRYDVVLYTDEQYSAHATRQPITWQTEVGFSPPLEQALRARRYPALHLTGIRNGRLARDEAARLLIHTGDEHAKSPDLRSKIDALEIDAADPEMLWQLGASNGYVVSLTWDSCEPATHFEARFLDHTLADQVPLPVSRPPESPRRWSDPGPWSEYSNDPLENSIAQRLIPDLREHLRRKLPDELIPPSWTVLKQLPRKPNGEVDWQAL